MCGGLLQLSMISGPSFSQAAPTFLARHSPLWFYGSDRKKQKASSNPSCPTLDYIHT
jgi:hypothetical protein